MLCAAAYIMSKKFGPHWLPLALALSYPPANFAPPGTYFEEAVLNVNLITPFGGQAVLNSFAQPSVKLVPGTKDQAAPSP
jgi:hypothetical protein